MPAIAAEMKVMISTAARVEISHFEMTSRWSHSSLVMRGITRSALPHMDGFIMTVLSTDRGESRRRVGP